MQLDLAARRGAGRHINNKWRLILPRPAEGDGVGAEQRTCAARRGDPGVAWRTGQPYQPCLGQRLNIGKQRGKMNAAINCQRRNAIVARLLQQQRQRALVGQQ